MHDSAEPRRTNRSAPRLQRLLRELRRRLRASRYSLRTEAIYVHWVRRFLGAMREPDPTRLGAADVDRFLECLATESDLAASTRSQARSALLFLFREIVGLELPQARTASGGGRAATRLLPSRAQVAAVLERLDARCWLLASLIHATGLRMADGLRLRVKDIDLTLRTLVIRDNAGCEQRRLTFPRRLCEPLRLELERVRRLHEADCARGWGRVWLPDALERRYPGASTELAWQYLFPSVRIARDAVGGTRRRQHADEGVLTRALARASHELNLPRALTAQTLRHCHAVHGPEPDDVPLRVREPRPCYLPRRRIGSDPVAML